MVGSEKHELYSARRTERLHNFREKKRAELISNLNNKIASTKFEIEQLEKKINFEFIKENLNKDQAQSQGLSTLKNEIIQRR